MERTDARRVPLEDLHPSMQDMRAEVLAGLEQEEKTLPCKYFYDARGSALFERICALPEYYLTRTELAILEMHAGEMAAALGPRVLLVEPGSGSSLKTRLLLDKLSAPAAYVPVDISRAPLVAAAAELQSHYPRLSVLPLCADFTEPFHPPAARGARRTVVYFPGSTLGNFAPPEAARLLRNFARIAGAGGGLLIGMDLKKDAAVLERAYNDSSGSTAEFNLNLLRRLNRELDADFDLERFAHRAVWNPALGRIEMRLVSRATQEVRVAGERFAFAEGEHILTECCYKYAPAELAALAARAGLRLARTWTDDRRWFCVAYLLPVSC